MNKSLTESSTCTREIVSDKMLATESWRILAHFLPLSLNGIVFVTTTSSKSEFSIFEIAGPEKTG